MAIKYFLLKEKEKFNNFLMYYEGGKPQPLSHHITSFSKGIAEDMLAFILFLFFFFFIALIAFELQRNKTEYLQARNYKLTTVLLFDFLASHFISFILFSLSVKQG